jgi:hypothetical protein
LWKSGARRMVTRRGGWVLWEVREGREGAREGERIEENVLF